jgi:hypothetical protein
MLFGMSRAVTHVSVTLAERQRHPVSVALGWIQRSCQSRLSSVMDKPEFACGDIFKTSPIEIFPLNLFFIKDGIVDGEPSSVVAGHMSS